MRAAPFAIALAGAALLAAAPAPRVKTTVAQKAEVLAAGARAHAADPASLAEAWRALAMTDDFDPTAFVRAGRKGEIVDDTYRQALGEYRRHRARLYEAVGACLDGSGQARAAVRYLRRALVLDPEGADLGLLARALVHDNRGYEALDAVTQNAVGPLGVETVAAAGEAADLAGVASLQAEIDRARVARVTLLPRPEPREGPINFGERLRLSTGAPFRLDEDGITVVYVADPSCRSCSQDLEELKRLVPPTSPVRVVVAPSDPEQDRSIRQALDIYRIPWPVVLGTRAGAYGADAPLVWVVARRGWSGAVVRPPFGRVLPIVIEILGRSDVNEALPRAKWTGRPAVRRALPPQPSAIAEDLVPGEDDPAPAEYDAAVKALHDGRASDALAAITTLAARADGWLLPAEAKLDRAVCLSRQGDTATARRLLRGIGDSRFQEHVDKVLESLGTRE